MRTPRALAVLLCGALGIAAAAISLVVLTGEDGPAVDAGAVARSGGVGGPARVELSPVLPRPGVGGGTAFVVSTGRAPALVVRARLPALRRGEMYEIWLYNSVSDARSLGPARSVGGGLFQGGGRLPRGYARRWRHLDVSRQSGRTATGVHSGESVVRGELRP